MDDKTKELVTNLLNSIDDELAWKLSQPSYALHLTHMRNEIAAIKSLLEIKD